jgi:hypothetical protein
MARPMGARNRISEEAREKALAGGMTPLQFLLATMRDESRPIERRLAAATAAAPYSHARLTAVQHSGPNGAPIQVEQQAAVVDARSMTSEERDTMRQILLAAKARKEAGE